MVPDRSVCVLLLLWLSDCFVVVCGVVVVVAAVAVIAVAAVVVGVVCLAAVPLCRLLAAVAVCGGRSSNRHEDGVRQLLKISENAYEHQYRDTIRIALGAVVDQHVLD